MLSQRYSVGLSPATIRNTLQDLEEMGLITQPHTSAGRIPTDAGYRVYVDSLVKPHGLTPEEAARIRASIHGGGKSIDAILGQSSKVLAEITHEMGVTVAPKFDQGVLTRLQLVSLSSQKILVVMVVKSGLAQSVILEVEANVSPEELSRLEVILNEKLCGLTLGEIRQTVAQRLATVDGSPRLLELFLDISSDVWNRESSSQMHVAGAENLVQQPEFANRVQLAEFVRTVEERERLTDALRRLTNGSGVVVTIGAENPLSEITHCSIVSAEYNAGSTQGRVAVIGPTRMHYSKLLSIVEYTAHALSEKMTSLEPGAIETDKKSRADE